MERAERLTPEEERLLLRIARDALTAHVREGRTLSIEAYPLTEALREKRGAFVTLHAGRDLRGCIGSIVNRTPLAEAVRDNAVNAAAHDFRFAPVTAAELSGIRIEISALAPGDAPETPFKRVRDVSEIVIGRDGLYIERPGSRGGLLLPQVAAERGWSVEEFLRAVCQKAGYPEDAWSRADARLCRFSAQVFAESSPSSEAAS
ncbi:MAG TPA: AmmeMemoRadiSam system protein A [Candidatus Hydrogenedentes bacterium]|nr:AmmeMemoRadiSam system protein A [Candidatus Hydrogenedentota bacterium]HOS01764.1 AmmeMemoRadiSam system protein A [Candidatus Hydrogenedentota bacterium]